MATFGGHVRQTKTGAHMAVSGMANRLVGSRFARSAAVLAGGTAIAQVVVVLTSPLLTRIYSPADFGTLSVYVSILTFVLGISTLRYHLAVPLVSAGNALASLLVLNLAILAAMLVGVVIGIQTIGRDVAIWTNTPGLEHVLWILPFGITGASLIQLLTAWAVRHDHFRTLGRIRIRQSVSQVVAQIGLSVAAPGGLGLVTGDAVGRAAGGLSLSRMAWKEIRDDIRHVSLRSIIDVGNQYRRFPLISTWTGVIASAGSQLPTLLVAGFYGASVVGWFGLCQRLLSMSFVLVASAIGTVFLSESARLSTTDPRGLLRLYWATVSRSSLLALVLVVGVVIFAPLLIGPLLGSEWTEAGKYAQVLAISAGFQFVNRAVSSATTVVQRQDLDLLGEVLWTVSATGSLLIGWSIDASPFTTIAMYSAGISLGSLLCLGLSWYAIAATIRSHNPPQT